MRRLLLAATVLVPMQAFAQTLTVGVAAPVTSIDPHFYNSTPNNSMFMHMFDTLVMRDAQARLRPGLAESWRNISDTEWEFKLRPNVTWHDGQPFTADDVIFSYERVPNVPNSPGGYAGFVRSIVKMEAVDPLTLRIHTAAPAPNLPTELAAVAIVSRHVGQNATTEDYNSGKAAIGTGPYRYVAYRAKEVTELARNDAYWGGQQHWQRVLVREIPGDGARTAALLSGDVDVIDQVPAADLARLRREPRVRISETQGLRMIFLQFDFSRTGEEPFVTDNDGKPLAQNPFLDLRVRQALSMAIDRNAIAQRVMEGTATPTMQWMPEGAYGYVPDLRPAAVNQAEARRLLTEAGFPNGFRMTLHTPQDRYPNDSQTSQAVAAMWTRIGVQTQVEALPWSSFSVRMARLEFSARLLGWGSTTGEPSYMIVNILNTYDRDRRTGANNHGRYSNPELDTMTARASSILDNAERERALQDATRFAIADLGVIPLHQLMNYWASKPNLTVEPRMDERSIAMSVRPAN